jgi:hypothetical protein
MTGIKVGKKVNHIANFPTLLYYWWETHDYDRIKALDRK